VARAFETWRAPTREGEEFGHRDPKPAMGASATLVSRRNTIDVVIPTRVDHATNVPLYSTVRQET
jgi:hypothetical protein